VAEPLRFVDSWTVKAPLEAVFAVLSDLRTYPAWGAAGYKSCQADGPPAVGRVIHVCVKGPLPFQIRFDAAITRLESPREVHMTATGDFDGEWSLRLEPTEGAVKIHSDWLIRPRRPPPRLLAPLLRPIFHWNHTSLVKGAYQGLQRYLDEATAQPQSVRS